MRRLGLLLATLLAVTGCGHGPYTSAAAVGHAMGCSTFDGDSARPDKIFYMGSAPTHPEWWRLTFEDESGTCTLEGDPYEILWSHYPGAMLNFVTDLGPRPKDPSSWLHADGWVVHCPSAATCRAVQDRIGGSTGLPPRR